MHSSTFFTVFALATAAVAAPVPNDNEPSWTLSELCSGSGIFSGLEGSPFCNGNGNGNNNEAGLGNDGNAAGNGAGAGSSNGDGNTFGNGNSIGSGNSGLKIGRNEPESFGDMISDLLGSPFGNGNGNGNGNAAGNGNDDNASGNGANAGSGNGDSNIFGNGNSIGSGNDGISIGRRSQKVRKSPTETLGTYVGTIIDDVTVPLEPGSANSLIGSPFNNGQNNGNSNIAGSNNDGNGSGNGAGAGSNNGDGNTFGNNNDILSGNCAICSGPVRQLPDGFLDIIPDQTVTSLNKDFSQIATDGPGDVVGILAGAFSGDVDGKFNAPEKRQVLTGVEDVIAEDLAKYLP